MKQQLYKCFSVLYNINPSECMTDVGFQEFRDIGLQPVGLDLETKGSNDYVDGLMPGVSYWN